MTVAIGAALYNESMSAPAVCDARTGVADRVETYLGDAVLGVLLFGAVSWMIYADQAGDRAPDVLAYLWAMGLGGLMLVRRRFPLWVLWTTTLGIFAYYAAGYPAVGLGVPTAGALLSAAEFRKLRWPVGGAVILLGLSYGVRLAQGQDFMRIIGFQLAGDLGLMVAAIALGLSVKYRRRLKEQTHQLLAAVAEQERSQTRAAIATERSHIARELHDSLGHQATVISMHADVAREALSTDPPAAEQALETVKRTSTEMMAELRGTLRALRQRQASGSPREPYTLAALRSTFFDALPLQITADIDDDAALPAAVQTAAHRIIQEGLTNVVKHSQAQRAAVSVQVQRDAVEVEVSDPGPSNPNPPPAGFGIVGMRERATSLGGTLSAEAVGQGFRVHARLPLAEGAMAAVRESR